MQFRSHFGRSTSLSIATLIRSIAILLLSIATASAANPLAPNETDIKRSIREALKLTRNGSFEQAEDLLRKALTAGGGSRTDVKVELAYVLTKQRRLGEAYELILPIAQAEPKNARAFAVFGATMLSGGRFSDARLLFFNALKLNRREHLAWAGYGLLDFYENKINDSLDNLRESVFHAPDEPDYHFALAQVSARAEKY